MPELLIRIKKNADDTAALSCTRADGSVTWQRQTGLQGAFFPLHDLTHYAVETVLRRWRGFYALLAEGWDIGDFGKPWPRGPLPAEAELVERIVGFLDAERASGTRWTAAEFNQHLRASSLAGGAASPLTEDELIRIRAERARLFERWRATPNGGALELAFDRGR